MGKKILVSLFLLYGIFSQAQDLRLRGNVSDSSRTNGLPNALLMAIKFSDSTLVGFSRTDQAGIFKPISVPLDTYIVILSHPAFSDKTYLLVPSTKDTAFTFKNVMLPPKSIVLNEVEVIAPKDKSYYKGDTLIFTADSFKTAANATVEDLLKKLPGVRVDAKGKITIQGKEVDQVLVDGDEFFGTDPTIATRNLNASSIENVQVYDKKNESAEDGKSETLKVVNLQMKEDSKKGYFGKVSGASDFNKFYENELLANKFKGNLKLSVFGIFANTPKQAFGWDDANKYGLSGEQPYQYDEETGSWTSQGGSKEGIPRTLRTGFYFSDKIGKKTKLNADYTFSQNQLQSGTETNKQFFLKDTSYSNSTTLSKSTQNQTHNFNFRLNQKLDSLTDITVAPKISYKTSGNTSFQKDDFTSENGEKTRSTQILNRSDVATTDANILIKLNRNFNKKERNLILTYQPIYNTSESTTNLKTDFIYYKNQLRDSTLDQRRTQSVNKLEHNAALLYTEPLSKKFKAQVNYNFSYNTNTNNRQTFDNSGAAYDLFNTPLSNNFENKRLINRGGLKLIYEVKKYRLSLGSNLRNVQQENLNLSNNVKLKQSFNNVLPNAGFMYKIGQGSNLNVVYSSSSQQPEISQMQPVVDNSDPNRISIGNPNLKPTFANNFNLNYYIYKGISDVNFYMGSNASNTKNQISYSTIYDTLGRAVTQPINVNGNNNASLYMGGGHPLFKRYIKVSYNLSGGYYNNVSFVNGQRNNSQNTNFGPQITIYKNADKFEASVSGDYNYNLPKSDISIQSNQPYYTYSLEGNFNIRLPKKFTMTADGKYTNNGNRTPGYNLNYFILNASIGKSFLKAQNLIVSISGNDLLNQNISNTRYINSNQIVDTKTQVIKRYFLLKVLFKFNSQKEKLEEENDAD